MAIEEGAKEDPTGEYDRVHGHPNLADEQKLVNLSESGNKPPPQQVAFTITKSS